MGLNVSIKNDEPAGSGRRATVTVVTVGNLDKEDQKHILEPQGSVNVPVHAGQFVLVDETEAERG